MRPASVRQHTLRLLKALSAIYMIQMFTNCYLRWTLFNSIGIDSAGSQSTSLKNLNSMYVHVELDDALDSSKHMTR